MKIVPQPGLAECLSAIWSALHDDVELTISDSEVHYLRTVALACEEDLVSHLLLKKLRIANTVPESVVDEGIVVMNSFVEYVFDGGPRRFCQLVHPSQSAPSYGLAAGSLAGAGIVGMRSGQTILWPSERGTLCDLQVTHVENRRGLGDWPGSRFA